MARTGRPALLEPNAVLAVHHLPIPQQALELGVSTGTVKRQWKRLRDDGLVPLGDLRLPRRGGAARGRICQQSALDALVAVDNAQPTAGRAVAAARNDRDTAAGTAQRTPSAASSRNGELSRN